MTTINDPSLPIISDPTPIPLGIQPLTKPGCFRELATGPHETKRQPGFFKRIFTSFPGRLTYLALSTSGNLPQCRLWAFALILLMALCPLQVASASAPSHYLRVELDLSTGTLHGRSEIRHAPLASATLDYFLHPRMQLHSVHLDGQPVAHRFDNGRLRITSGMTRIGEDTLLSISYSGIFHDPVPLSQFSTDNTGFGVTATITEQGVFFQGQSGWFPRSPDHNPPVNLEVVAPAGVLAVTAGRLLGHSQHGDQSISRWRVDQLGRGMPLSAGRYVQRQLKAGSVPIFTYFFPDSDHLAPIYLEASARHVATYEDLHGPYPFDQFAVVENFFPSGFGMPSYTLLGSAILRLPFIPETSLRHEVAHCWWGNGVFVDYSQGNWSEGLTTYVADYLSQEEKSLEAAREYRVRILRDYALLAAGQADFPVARFLSRSDPASQVVGYGKAMYLIHMIRRQMGDEPFWDALRAFYDQWLFQKATWQDMFDAFAHAGWKPGWNPERNFGPGHEATDRGESTRKIFTRQWLLNPGAPDLRLQDVQVRQLDQGWQVDAQLVQSAPYFHLSVPVHLETASGSHVHLVNLQDETTTIAITSPNEPRRLVVDPEHHLFRLLAPEEIPPTVNSIRGASGLLLIRSAAMDHVPEEIVRGFLRSMNQPRARIIHEHEVQEHASRASRLLFFGLPTSESLRALVVVPEIYTTHPATGQMRAANLLPKDTLAAPAQRQTPAAISEITSEIPSVTQPSDSDATPDELDTLFLVLPHPIQTDGVVALFSPGSHLDAEAVADTARRINHYGKDSFLGFYRGQNRLRGAWPALASPLIKDLQP
ncbi:M1 family metallopeptidase [Desulfonatronum thioautotrophicum]|uniref:M1 family metallopeptidase n=1 Tax=Desulfonatronum thioautotrophicum TaxID=617001 RepID=UPI0012946BEB|nr:M1 family aminopeptidase [Desulfonatronum thioautotrophicum]